MKTVSSIVNKCIKKIPEGTKASMAFVVCSFLQQGIQLITIPIFTRILTTAQYGQYSLYQSWLSIVSVLATLNLSAGCFNKGMSKYPGDRNRFISSLQGLTTILTGVWIVTYLLMPGKWEELLGLPNIVIFGMLVETLLSPALSFWSMRQRYEYKYKLLVVVSLAISILNPCLGLIAVSNVAEKGIARCLTVSAVSALFGLIFYTYNFRKGKQFFSKEYWIFALKFNLPLVPHYLSQIVLAQSDRIMIGSMFGTSKVAVYSIAYNIGTIMSIIITSVNSSFIPWTYERCKSNDYMKIGYMANKLTVLMAFVALVPIVFAPEAIKFFGTQEYIEAVWVVPPVAIGTFFTFVYSIFANIEFYYEKSILVMIASISTAIINVILNVVFMPLFGYIAAGYTTVFCYLLFACIHYLFMKRVMKENGINSIYNIDTIIGISVVLIILTSICMIGYKFLIVRLMIILILTIIIVTKRKWFIQVIKSRRM